MNTKHTPFGSIMCLHMIQLQRLQVVFQNIPLLNNENVAEWVSSSHGSKKQHFLNGLKGFQWDFKALCCNDKLHFSTLSHRQSDQSFPKIALTPPSNWAQPCLRSVDTAALTSVCDAADPQGGFHISALQRSTLTKHPTESEHRPCLYAQRQFDN